jgi:ribosomal protein S21
VINVEKKEGESNDSMMRRFTRKVQSSGTLIRKKKGQYRQKEPNKRARRISAIRRTKAQQERAYLIKIGKLEETPRFGPRKKAKKS